MIKLKNILSEIVYSNIATVYHRTEVEDLADKVYDTGFIPGDGAMYGKGMYSTYDLASQERPGMSKNYGKTILKCAVDLSDFFFFDWSEFAKTPLYKFKLTTSTKKTFIQDQIVYYKIVLWQPDTFNAKAFESEYSSNTAFWLYMSSNLDKKVAGIVFTGEHDGKVLLCYDTKRIRPLAFKNDGDIEFSKIEDIKKFINNPNVSTVSTELTFWNSIKNRLQKNPDGTFDLINGSTEIDSEENLRLWSKFFPRIKSIQGSLSLHNIHVKSLKVFKNLDIKGNFEATNLALKSLIGCPQSIGSSFICSENNLTTLKGAPEKIKGSFDCAYNKLTSLEGSPKEVDENFECSRNQLTTLKGAPSFIGGNFFCYGNLLTSVEDGPKIVKGSYGCSNNKLTTLKGVPSLINGNFECSRNQLTTLKDAPEIIKEDFWCTNNPLTSLEGCPKMVGGDFIHSSEFSADEIRKVCNVKGNVIKQ
jgi:hypothetical protein